MIRLSSSKEGQAQSLEGRMPLSWHSPLATFFGLRCETVLDVEERSLTQKNRKENMFEKALTYKWFYVNILSEHKFTLMS